MGTWPNAEDLLNLHHAVVQLFDDSGDPIHFVGEREPGLADAAVSRPIAEFDGRPFYKTDRSRIAALVHSINSSHVFRDGNKRTSVAALVVLLDDFDWNFEATDEEVSRLMIDVSSKTAPFDGDTEQTVLALTAWINERTTKKQHRTGALDTLDFLNRCEKVGGSWKTADASYVLFGASSSSGSVRISRSTTSLDAPVVKNYLSKVGLSEAYTGVPIDQFAEGKVRKHALIRRYQGALQLLADHDRSDD